MRTLSKKSAMSMVLMLCIILSTIVVYASRVNAATNEVHLRTYDQTSGNENAGGKVGNADNGDMQGWAKNGECAGTAGRSARLEGIQIVLVPKGSPAPGATYEGITAVTETPFVEGF